MSKFKDGSKFPRIDDGRNRSMNDGLAFGDKLAIVCFALRACRLPKAMAGG